MVFSELPKKLNPDAVSLVLWYFKDDSYCQKMFRLAVFLFNVELYGCASVIIDHMIAYWDLEKVFDEFYDVCYEECVLNLNVKVFEFIVDRLRVKGALGECVKLMVNYEEFVVSSLCFNSVLRDLVKCGNLELFWEVCGRMLGKEGLFDVYTYTNMIKAHCMVGNVIRRKGCWLR